MHVVPTQTHLEVEVAQREVDRQQLTLELVIEDVVVTLTFDIYVHVVATEVISERWTGETARMDSELTACHQTLTQTQDEVGIHRDGCMERNIQTHLHGCIFLRVVAHTQSCLHRLAVACRERHAHPVAVGYHLALCRLVEEINTHRRGELLLQFRIDAVQLIQVELITQESLILRSHVMEHVVRHILLVRHHPRILRMEQARTERIVDANHLLQCHQFVPVLHRLLFATTDERVDGS